MKKTSRRVFARNLAVAGAAGAVLPLVGQTTAPVSATPEVQTKSTALADALAEVVRAQHGRHLTSVEIEQIRNDFREFVPYATSLRDFPLENRDEPDFTFHSLVERW